MPFIEKLWFDISLMFWGLVNLRLHTHQYFYQDAISRKVTNQGYHEAWLPSGGRQSDFQYYDDSIVIIIIIIIIIIIVYR